ncbi:unnamed protein product, partial [Prunus brigantina]
MFNLRRVLERQHREDEEIRCRGAEEDHELDEEEEEVVSVVGMLNQSRQHHRGHAPNVDRHRHSRECNPICSKKIMHDVCNYDTYFVQKYDALGVLGLLSKQKLTTTLQMLAYGASANQWKNCPTAWQGDYGNRKGQQNIILEVVASFDTWVWHVFFGVSGSQNDLNVLGQSPVFNDVLRGHSP